MSPNQLSAAFPAKHRYWFGLGPIQRCVSPHTPFIFLGFVHDTDAPPLLPLQVRVHDVAPVVNDHDTSEELPPIQRYDRWDGNVVPVPVSLHCPFTGSGLYARQFAVFPFPAHCRVRDQLPYQLPFNVNPDAIPPEHNEPVAGAEL
ncbi:MAG: hypothetical protein LBG52_06215 [Candidatus Peribacteria bacterium]|nr:hypothetical protein [Candidatus Peribacteria bacterium]